MRRTPLHSGGRRGRSTQAEPVGDLGLVTGRAQPGLRQQHDVDAVVLIEGGYVRPPPGCSDGSCIEEADKECVFGRGRTKGNVKQLSVRGTQRSAERGGCEVVTVTGWRRRWYGSGVMLTLARVREESRTETVKVKLGMLIVRSV